MFDKEDFEKLVENIAITKEKEEPVYAPKEIWDKEINEHPEQFYYDKKENDYQYKR